MKLLSALALGVLILSSAARLGAQTGASGDSAGTRAALARAAEENPKDIAALTGYAEFLERYGDPTCREAYAKLLEALRNTGDTARAGLIARPGGNGDLAHCPNPRSYAPVCPHGGHLAGGRRGRSAFRRGAQRGDQRLPGVA